MSPIAVTCSALWLHTHWLFQLLVREEKDTQEEASSKELA